jgi:hypothetical protein
MWTADHDFVIGGTCRFCRSDCVQASEIRHSVGFVA